MAATWCGDVSFAVKPGDILCLLGPSGCGKSTVLRTIAGIERQAAGRIVADGQVLSDGMLHLPPERRGIGLIFQDFALFPHLSVGQNVAFGLSGSRSEVRERVNALLARVDLKDYADKSPHMLSGGEQQRVALARAMAPRPRIMLMDEPFSGLDNRLRDGIRDETLEILKEDGTAVVLVTHEPEEAMRMADQIALMRGGKIVQVGAPYNVYNAPCDRAAAAFFSDINVVTGTVRGALTTTPFGEFLAPGYPDGSVVDIVFRPQHVKIDFDRKRAGAEPHAARRGAGTRRGAARALHGARKPRGVPHGFRRQHPQGDRPRRLSAETRQAAVADRATRPLFRLSAIAIEASRCGSPLAGRGG